MDPALWNQNGTDSGAESPESESIFSGWTESQSESIPHGHALLESESESAPVFHRFRSAGINHKSDHNAFSRGRSGADTGFIPGVGAQ